MHQSLFQSVKLDCPQKGRHPKIWRGAQKIQGTTCFGQNVKHQENTQDRNVWKNGKLKTLKVNKRLETGDNQRKNVLKSDLNANRSYLQSVNTWLPKKVKARAFNSFMGKN